MMRTRKGSLPRARKRFGQNFLEPAWVEKVIRAIDPQSDDTFVEIGPGHGALTHPLAARAKRVFAYEIDRDLAAALRSTAASNVEVVEGDVLSTLASRQPTPDFSTLDSLRVAGNLPYNVASPILFKLAALYASGLPIADATGPACAKRRIADAYGASVVWITIRVIGDENGRSARWKFFELAATQDACE